MNRFTRFATTGLVSGGLCLAGLGLGAGTAQAQTPPGGPYQWCPGQELPRTGNQRVNPVIWDMNVCHTYWYVYHGQGNAAQNLWDGDNPPAPPPPPVGFTPPLPPGQCWYLFIPGPC